MVFLTKPVKILHTGHIGDIIAFLPSFQRLGGTHLVIKDEQPWMAPMSGFKYNSIKPLLESQGINVSFNDANCVDYDMSNWRECYRDDISLADAQARYCGVVPKDGFLELNAPWIRVDGNPDTMGRVIFNRSPRYNNDLFPWPSILEQYLDEAIFIGTEHEYDTFVTRFGFVDYFPTKDCLEVAQAIASCSLFVGNQSSAFWIAAALRKPLIQEVYPPAPNSIIKYPGASYCFGGKVNYV